MKIDPQARSSMWEDLQRGRRTEIDYLQGVIAQIAERHGLKVPLSERIVKRLIDSLRSDAHARCRDAVNDQRGGKPGRLLIRCQIAKLRDGL